MLNAHPTLDLWSPRVQQLHSITMYGFQPARKRHADIVRSLFVPSDGSRICASMSVRAFQWFLNVGSIGHKTQVGVREVYRWEPIIFSDILCNQELALRRVGTPAREGCECGTPYAQICALARGDKG